MEHTSQDISISIREDDSVSRCALRLAMSVTMAEETTLKELLESLGFRCVVTETGGRSSGDFQEKITRAVLGASLNARLVEKVDHEIHALLHATEEAKRCVLSNTASVTSLAVKIAVVRKGHWISVALYGDSSIHPITTHERCGVGTMHI